MQGVGFDTANNYCTSTALRGIGAHQAHVRTGSGWHKDTTCDQCHLVPSGNTDSGHCDTLLPAELTWSGLAAGASWNGTTMTCQAYCHGDAMSGGSAINPLWTQVDGSLKQCGSCHGAPPPPPHTTLTNCGLCHDTMTPGVGMILTDPARHIDGWLDVRSTLPCHGCHGSMTNAAPPADTLGNSSTTFRGVGAHQDVQYRRRDLLEPVLPRQRSDLGGHGGLDLDHGADLLVVPPQQRPEHEVQRVPPDRGQRHARHHRAGAPRQRRQGREDADRHVDAA